MQVVLYDQIVTLIWLGIVAPFICITTLFIFGINYVMQNKIVVAMLCAISIMANATIIKAN